MAFGLHRCLAGAPRCGGRARRGATALKHASVPARPAPDAPPRPDQHGPASHARLIRRWIWRDFLNMGLGVWLIASPATLGYTSRAMAWSDLIAGAAIVALSALVLRPRFDLARWGLCAAGLWLLFAPLVLWTPDPGAYANGTLVGALVITFSVLVPMMPGRTHHAVMTGPGPDTPPGWSYNPSDFLQRGPIVAMALVGFFLSRYLAAYQLGHIAAPWDPVFGGGTRRVLDSEVSRAFPISDAGLGAAAYLIEALSGCMGGVNRWRTMPWMVGMFGVLVVPLGIVSIVLVVLQPIAVGAWCALCLATAAAMLVMIAPALDEVVATGQFLAGARREGQPFWRTFWVGGTLDRYGAGGQRPHDADVPARRAVLAALDLNHVPWNMVAAAAVGVWIMAAPAALGAGGPAAGSNYLTGALVVTFSVIAWGEIARPSRLLNLPLGLWLVAASAVFAAPANLRWSNAAAGLAVAALSLRRGRVETRFGAWNRVLI